MKPRGDFPKMSVVSPVAKTVLVKLTSRHVPYNCSSAARIGVDINSANKNPARNEIAFFEFIIFSPFSVMNIQLSFIKKGKLKKGREEKAPKGKYESPWGLHIGTFRINLLISSSRRLEVRLLVSQKKMEITDP